jgi:hypothetical protein
MSLVLPNAAEVTASGNFGTPTFQHFSNLTSVKGANVGTISPYAFHGSTSLTSADFPTAQSINVGAFYSCTVLESVNLPAATFIYGNVFSFCTSLTTLNLPASPPTLMGTTVFVETGTGSLPLTIHVPVGAVGNYMSTWGVSDSTGPNGNQAVYGFDHKAINIVGDLL